jgi:DNA-binding NarL/FixJ family response regulator
MNRLEAAHATHDESPEADVLILTVHFSEDVAREVFRSGARGYVLKSDADCELEIVQLLATGQIRKEVAATVGICTRTVQRHRNHLMKKTEFLQLQRADALRHPQSLSRTVAVASPSDFDSAFVAAHCSASSVSRQNRWRSAIGDLRQANR